MATLSNPSPPSTPPFSRKSKAYARKCERYCCICLSFFPVCMVYGLTTWAVWVGFDLGFHRVGSGGPFAAIIQLALYILLNWSYTTAVFTDPGSPLTATTGTYSVLPTHSTSLTSTRPHTNERAPSTVTVKSDGKMRFCKKCNLPKPDRAHHCSTCRRCVLKMDHHCPWLATCVGLRNYKAFLLFLIYVSLFCWQSFILSGAWVWTELFDDRGFEERLMPVNYILLAALGSIIGLVITGFTSWHIYLACKGQTTIESLEKQRYLTPLRRQLGDEAGRHYLDPQAADEVDPEDTSLRSQIRNIHANMVPGVTRPEEGEERPAASSARHSLRQHLSYAEREAQRERDRYADYLDEEASAQLPHAFDHGVRANLRHLFGDPWYLRWLPICNTSGDGWQWPPSEKWQRMREELARKRVARNEREPYLSNDPIGSLNYKDQSWNPRADVPGSPVPMRTFDSRIHSTTNSPPAHDEEHTYSSSEDEAGRDDERKPLRPAASSATTSNWNDIPEGFLDAPSRSGARSRSGQRRPSPRPR